MTCLNEMVLGQMVLDQRKIIEEYRKEMVLVEEIDEGIEIDNLFENFCKGD